jgi:hypothetical protein
MTVLSCILGMYAWDLQSRRVGLRPWQRNKPMQRLKGYSYCMPTILPMIHCTTMWYFCIVLGWTRSYLWRLCWLSKSSTPNFFASKIVLAWLGFPRSRRVQLLCVCLPMELLVIHNISTCAWLEVSGGIQCMTMNRITDRALLRMLITRCRLHLRPSSPCDGKSDTQVLIINCKTNYFFVGKHSWNLKCILNYNILFDFL